MKGSKELIRDTLLKLDGISDNDEWVDLVDRYELDCSPDHLRKLGLECIEMLWEKIPMKLKN